VSREVSSPRSLPRADMAILAGMTLSIASLFCVWQRIAVPAGSLTPLPGALYTQMAHLPAEIVKTGFGTPARWPLTVGATLCGALLLISPTARTRLPLASVQGASGLTCVLIALHWLSRADFAWRPGAWLAVLGGGLLLFGAVDRFQASAQTSDDGERKNARS
jgi:hypothetical protein